MREIKTFIKDALYFLVVAPFALILFVLFCYLFMAYFNYIAEPATDWLLAQAPTQQEIDNGLTLFHILWCLYVLPVCILINYPIIRLLMCIPYRTPVNVNVRVR